MTLRGHCVEAMARTRWAERFAAVTRVLGTPRELPDWGGEFIEESEAQLDALLDVLGEHAEDGHWLASIGDVIDLLRTPVGPRREP